LKLPARKPSQKADLSTDGFEFLEVIPSPKPDALPSQLVWAEVNLLALPFAVLDEREARTSPGHEIIKFDKNNGKQIVWLWRVWPDPKIGMPTMATMRVLFALMNIAEETRKFDGAFPDRVYFSLSELCRLIGWASDGRHRAMVKKHIEILVSTSCKSKGAFKDKDRNGLIIDAFSYIRRAAFIGELDENDQVLETNFVIFEDPVRLNLERRYIKQLDVALLRSIKSSIGQLLYTKLSHLFHEAKRKNEKFVDVSYQWLAERMGIKMYNHVWEAKKQLANAIRELIALEYIHEPTWNGWTIRFEADIRYELGESAPRLQRKKALRAQKNHSNQTLNRMIPREAFPAERDMLQPLCALYAQAGWKYAEPQAKRRSITEEQLKEECELRGLL
jgi:hypothetical protein